MLHLIRCTPSSTRFLDEVALERAVKNIAGTWPGVSPINQMAQKIYSFIPKELFKRVEAGGSVAPREMKGARERFEEQTYPYIAYREGGQNGELEKQVLESFFPILLEACAIDGCLGRGGREGRMEGGREGVSSFL